MWPKSQKTADLVTFTEEIYDAKLIFFVQWLNFFLKLGFKLSPVY